MPFIPNILRKSRLVKKKPVEILSPSSLTVNTTKNSPTRIRVNGKVVYIKCRDKVVMVDMVKKKVQNVTLIKCKKIIGKNLPKPLVVKTIVANNGYFKS